MAQTDEERSVEVEAHAAALRDLLQTRAGTAGERLRGKASQWCRDLALLVLIVGGVVAYFQGLPVTYVTDTGPGEAKPGEIPPAMAFSYAERWVVARYTFTPKTFKAMMTEMLRWVHPELQRRFEKDMEEEGKEVRKASLSSQVHIVQRAVLKSEAHRISVVLMGIRSVWVGSVPHEENLRAEITLVPWWNPGNYGHGHLIVVRAHVTPVFSATGQ